MSEPFSDPTFVDDLHELMTAAILAAQRGVDADTSAIFEAWGASYPQDALGPIGRGLTLIRMGKSKEGFSLIEEADNGAGAVGLAMQKMVAGDYFGAETLLDNIIANKPEGKSEAKAIKAMCKALQSDMVAAEKLHRELEGEGSSAEALAELIVDENAHEKYEEQQEQNDAGSQEPAHAAAG